MRTRFCATMRKPAFSMIALIAPVRLRLVASGLRIEKVRSTAIGQSSLFWMREKSAAYKERLPERQALRPKAGRHEPEWASSLFDTLYREPKGARGRLMS